MSARICIVVVLSALAGCSGASEDDSAQPTLDQGCAELRRAESSVTSDDDGVITVPVEVAPHDRSFLVTLEDPDQDLLMMVTEVEGPDGTVHLEYSEFWEALELHTGAILPRTEQAVLNWPVRAEDGPLAPGTWIVRAQGLTSWSYEPDSGEDIDVVTHWNSGPADGEACLSLRVVYADGVADEDGVTDAVTKAVDQAVGLFEGWGVDVTLTWQDDSTIDPQAPSPGYGDPVYNSVSGASGATELVLVVAEQLERTYDAGDILGESGNAPGTLEASDHSAVVVSWLEAAGSNGRFNDTEERELSETIAHEVGHYIGLHHPVTFDDDGDAVAWDSLDDTDTCPGWTACASALGENLMFPYAWCQYTDACDWQDQLSDGQQGLLHHYTGVR